MLAAVEVRAQVGLGVVAGREREAYFEVEEAIAKGWNVPRTYRATL